MASAFLSETNVPSGANSAARSPNTIAEADLPADPGDVIYPDDIDDWAERLEVTPEQLRAAIRRAGSRADDVARFLGNPDVI
jgi:hypothetical protein